MTLDELFSVRGSSTNVSNIRNLKSIQVSIASPENIREWSYGEVKKPETINYRTFKPERDGLFCAKIFGPVKDYECNCGKYKRMKHRGIVCEKCGVEVIPSKVRRERMGHIDLASPVTHIWFLKTLPSKIGTLLDISMMDLEKILYFDSYIILDAGSTNLLRGQILTEEHYYQVIGHYGEDSIQVGMGAEAIGVLLEDINLEVLRVELREEFQATRSQTKKKKLIKRLKVVEAFLDSKNKPEWMVMSVIPVIPPELRPLVPLDGGRFATSDLNDLYRRVINRNNRLKRLMDLGAPDIIIRNEKRMLQESVDALFDNGRRGRAITGTNGRPLKSLSDMIKGKQGRFRQNLLGKRVDYSGRSVIVVGPKLKLHQCGLPKKMALELFKPFIYAELERKGLATTIKGAKRMVEREELVVWDILEEVVREYPILLNRAPTLHRLGIQAFEPLLIEGKAIQLHPLVCSAYNADFDGDQMAVHIPLSVEAQVEARILMMSTNNILSPANGFPVIIPSQDIVLGLYYMTVERSFEKGEGMVFCAPWEVIAAYDAGITGLHARIKVRIDEEGGRIYSTTPGRVLIAELLPETFSFEHANCVLTKKSIATLVALVYREAGTKATVLLCDKLKDIGYEYATRAGVTIAVQDLKIPKQKESLLVSAQAEVDAIEKQYRSGIITTTERYNKVVDVWTKVTQDVAQEMINEISYDIVVDEKTGREEKNDSFNSIYMMSTSGARGNQDQMRQLAGMRGLMAKPSGEIIETPITSSFREGLSVLQYFTSTHGARKGLADTALKTANSGYLTRRLVDVVQDVIISEVDCGSVDGIELTTIIVDGEIKISLAERILGRVLLYPIYHPETRELLFSESTFVDERVAISLSESGVNTAFIRSALTCQSQTGICAYCYGRDLARGDMVNIGETVGIIAAQSIGEPGTQLTMRTFHIGGTASREIERSSIEAQHPGRVVISRLKSVINKEGQRLVLGKSAYISIVDEQGRERENYALLNGARLYVEDGQMVTKGMLLTDWDPFNEPFISEIDGIIKFEDIIEGRTYQEKTDDVSGAVTRIIVEYRATLHKPAISIVDSNGVPIPRKMLNNLPATYLLPIGALIMVNDGDIIQAGDVFARKPRESSKTKDIVGGLPRVAELFEVRKPKDPAVVAEIAGIVSFSGETKGRRRVIVTTEQGEQREYLILKGKHITVAEGDFIEAGEAFTEGSPELHDVLRTKGEKYLARYLVDEVQEVYRFQGVSIDDKHIEVIVRQMLKKVNVLDPKGSSFLVGEQVDKVDFRLENERVLAEGLEPAVAEPLVLGITQASLTTSSFISAASFQETTKVLTTAVLQSKVDHLKGLKENVIVGRLLPAGTGYREYVNAQIIRLNEDGTVEEELGTTYRVVNPE
ncbi:MAG: DNA-directed RNA polymerase subunit beta' [Desulfovibrionaceae bacterium]